MRRSIHSVRLIAVPLLVAALLFSLAWGAAAASAASVTIDSIDASCGSGGVVGSVTVTNNTDAAITDSIPLLLMQHFPGEAQFQPVPGGSFSVSISLAAGETASFSFGPISTADISADANALRVDTDVSARPDLNPEKSDSFTPCAAEATSTPPAPTSTPVPGATEVPSATPTEATATATPGGQGPAVATPAAPGGLAVSPSAGVLGAAVTPSVGVAGAAVLPQALPATGENSSDNGAANAPIALVVVLAGVGLLSTAAAYRARRRTR